MVSYTELKITRNYDLEMIEKPTQISSLHLVAVDPNTHPFPMKLYITNMENNDSSNVFNWLYYTFDY